MTYMYVSTDSRETQKRLSQDLKNGDLFHDLSIEESQRLARTRGLLFVPMSSIQMTWEDPRKLEELARQLSKYHLYVAAELGNGRTIHYSPSKDIKRINPYNFVLNFSDK